MTGVQVIIPTLFALIGSLFLWLPAETDLSRTSLIAKARRRAGAGRDTTRVHERLVQLGRDGQYEIFRARQFVIAGSVGAIGMLCGLVLTSSGGFSLILALSMALGSYIFVDRQLTQEVKKRLLAIENEFAPVIEMLTLALSAGETPISSLHRIAERSDGFLAAEFGRVVMEVRNGSPFNNALDAMGARTESVMIRRFVDALITAMMRGAPLIDVLQRHALEARANQRNTLLSVAGKAEISMMIPVVFLILPISVLFALWPSVTNLNLFAG
ncbi:MAG: type II secretion system F family protein [Actinobacteria bacterium]|nr:type II secretion system F family protein [Actinomycetota bacterium]